MFGKRPVQVDHATIPTAVFSQPEVGTVGLTEAEARAQFSHVDIYKTDFRPIKATMSGRDTRILMKLVVDGSTDRVLGCHIVGDTRRRNRPGGRDRGEDESHQGRFRCHHRAASDGGRRAGDDADADGAVCEAGGGVEEGSDAALRTRWVAATAIARSNISGFRIRVVMGLFAQGSTRSLRMLAGSLGTLITVHASIQ